jgi:hypothetical protein
MQPTADAINFVDAQFASASAAQYSVLVVQGVSPFMVRRRRQMAQQLAFHDVSITVSGASERVEGDDVGVNEASTDEFNILRT